MRTICAVESQPTPAIFVGRVTTSIALRRRRSRSSALERAAAMTFLETVLEACAADEVAEMYAVDREIPNGCRTSPTRQL
jgi:hypothetical protein